MVMPRSCSSARRSGSMPVSALTSADLPWSMCPAVPTMTWRMAVMRGSLRPTPDRPAASGRRGLQHLGQVLDPAAHAAGDQLAAREQAAAVVGRDGREAALADVGLDGHHGLAQRLEGAVVDLE